MTPQYEVKPGEPFYDGTPSPRFYILDTASTEPFPANLVRGRNGVQLSYGQRKDADRAADRLNRRT